MKAMQAEHNGITYVHFYCPGCKMVHSITTGGGEHTWGWNGSLESPTFTPSVLNWLEHRPDEDENEKRYVDSRRCHIYVTDGRIQFLSDCGHELAGQTVDIPDRDWSNYAG